MVDFFDKRPKHFLLTVQQSGSAAQRVSNIGQVLLSPACDIPDREVKVYVQLRCQERQLLAAGEMARSMWRRPSELCVVVSNA